MASVLLILAAVWLLATLMVVCLCHAAARGDAAQRAASTSQPVRRRRQAPQPARDRTGAVRR